MQADRAPRNKTLNTPLSGREKYLNRCIRVTAPVEDISQVLDKTIRGDVFGVRPLLPCASADLISADPPYSLTKAFSGATLSRMPAEAYGEYIRKRHYIGIEIDAQYCRRAEQRPEAAGTDARIQGYADGVFRERNTLNEQKRREDESNCRKGL